MITSTVIVEEIIVDNFPRLKEIKSDESSAQYNPSTIRIEQIQIKPNLNTLK